MKIHMGIQSKDGTVVVAHSLANPQTYATADEFWAARGRQKAYLLNADSGEWLAMDYNDNWPRPAPMATVSIPTPVDAMEQTHGS